MDSNKVDQIVQLNAGGKLLTTHLSTLTKEKSSKLCKMFEERSPTQFHYEKDGRYFIDFDGDAFAHVLNFLRNGSTPPIEMVLDVYECAKYFGIASLADALSLHHPVARRIAISENKKRGFDLEEYEKLKKIAVRALISNTHPGELRYLAFSAKGCNIYEVNGVKYVHQFYDMKDRHNMSFSDMNVQVQKVIYFNHNEVESMMKCLGHELCELGFGKYSFYSSYYGNKLKCSSPGCGIFNCHLIILQ